MSHALRARSPFVPACIALALACAPSVALAQPSPPNDETTTLEKQLAAEVTALSTSDCTSACRALASIRRAADKICGLEPGPRCASARAKADDASRRVREACPDCAIAAAPAPPPAPDAKPSSIPAKGSAKKDEADVATLSSPPSESKRGGCAGCATTKATHGDVAGVALVVAAMVRMLRRRRR